MPTPRLRGCTSLPAPARAPLPLEKVANSLPFSDLTTSTHNIQSQEVDGPVLHVTVAGTSFQEDGSYFLTLTSAGSRHHTHVMNGRSSRPNSREEHFAFPLNEADMDLELSISATRVRAGPPESPITPDSVLTGLHAAAKKAHGGWSTKAGGSSTWEEHVGMSTLRLSELLSCPQPAGSASKMHEVALASAHAGSRNPVGTVRLRWDMEDRAAEAREAAVRAADLHKQKVAAASGAAPTSAAATTNNQQHHREPAAGAKGHRSRRVHVVDVNKAQEEEEYREWAQREAVREAEARDFDMAMHRARWEDVLRLYRVVLWLPPGGGVATINLSAKQAVGLADLAASHGSGKVAFSHAGMRITLSREVARALRAKIEEKLKLNAREMKGDAAEAILVMADSGCLLSQTQRAVTVGGGEQREAEPEPEQAAGSSSSSSHPRHHLTAEPTSRPRPVHAHSAKWHDAAALPLARSPSGRIYRNGRLCALEQTPPTTPRGLERSQSMLTMPGGGGASGGASSVASNDEDAFAIRASPNLTPPSLSSGNISPKEASHAPMPGGGGTNSDATEPAALNVPRRAAGARRASSPPRARPMPPGTPGSAGHSPRRAPSCGALPTIGAASGSGRPAVGLTSSSSVAVLPSHGSYKQPTTPIAAASGGGARRGLAASQSMAELDMAPPTITYRPPGMYGGMRAGSTARLTMDSPNAAQ